MEAGSPISRFDPRRRPGLAGLAALALGLWTLGTTIAGVMAAHCDLPYADEWDTWQTWLHQGYSLGWFISQHADHRIAATRLLFAIGNGVFDARVWFPQAVSFAVQAGLAALLWRLAKRGAAADSLDSPVLGGAIVCCLFSAQQLINFTWGFQVQFFLVYASGAAALWALWRATEAAHAMRRRAWTAACLLAAVVCSYSMANGVLIWPLLVLMAVRQGAGRPAGGVLGASGVVVLAQYFYGWHTSGLDAAAPVWRVILFAMANAGSPLAPPLVALGAGTAFTGFASMGVGGALLALAAVQWVRALRAGPARSGARMVLANFTVFVAAASLAIAAGRAHLPMAAAFRARYMTPACILWACLLLVAWPRLRSLGPRRVRWAVVVAALVGVACTQVPEIRRSRDLGNEMRHAAAALAVGVNDPAVSSILGYTFDYLAPIVEHLKRHKLSIFADEWTGWTGQSLATRFQTSLDGSACHGGVGAVELVRDAARPGWRLSGWAHDRRGGSPSRIVLADPAGRIAGVALGEGGEWYGYALPGTPRVMALAVEPDGKPLCFLGTQVLAPR